MCAFYGYGNGNTFSYIQSVFIILIFRMMAGGVTVWRMEKMPDERIRRKLKRSTMEISSNVNENNITVVLSRKRRPTYPSDQTLHHCYSNLQLKQMRSPLQSVHTLFCCTAESQPIREKRNETKRMERVKKTNRNGRIQFDMGSLRIARKKQPSQHTDSDSFHLNTLI